MEDSNATKIVYHNKESSVDICLMVEKEST